MFEREYSFKGSHADKVNKLTAKFDDKNQLFKRNLDVYLMAPIVGFLYQRKSEISYVAGDQKPTKIFPEQIINSKDDLLFNYRLIMLLDNKNNTDIETRVNKAFRYYDNESADNDKKIYEQYVLGGVDVLFEKLISTARNSEDYLKNLYDFMEEIDERYNQTVEPDQISELCRLAKQ